MTDKKDKGDKNMDITVERYCSITESLEESLRQMKLIREGKLPKKTWKEFKKEIEGQDSNDNK